jgi:hypothetical protein
MKLRITGREKRKVIEQYDTLKQIGMICEFETEEGERVFVVKLFGSLYINMYTGEAYICEPLGMGKCKCEYSEPHTRLVHRAMTEGIRLI